MNAFILSILKSVNFFNIFVILQILSVWPLQAVGLNISLCSLLIWNITASDRECLW